MFTKLLFDTYFNILLKFHVFKLFLMSTRGDTHYGYAHFNGPLLFLPLVTYFFFLEFENSSIHLRLIFMRENKDVLSNKNILTTFFIYNLYFKLHFEKKTKGDWQHKLLLVQFCLFTVNLTVAAIVWLRVKPALAKFAKYKYQILRRKRD